MPINELRHLPRLSAGQAAVMGTTRALEKAFPIVEDEATSHRLGNAVAALVAADAAANLQGAAETV